MSFSDFISPVKLKHKQKKLSTSEPFFSKKIASPEKDDDEVSTLPGDDEIDNKSQVCICFVFLFGNLQGTDVSSLHLKPYFFILVLKNWNGKHQTKVLPHSINLNESL